MIDYNWKLRDVVLNLSVTILYLLWETKIRILLQAQLKGCNFEIIHKTIILLRLLHLEEHSVCRWNQLTTCRHISGFPAVRKPEEYDNGKSPPVGRQYDHVVYSRGGTKFSIRFSSPRCVASRLYFKQQQRREDINWKRRVRMYCVGFRRCGIPWVTY
jgi:hypothetical protein